MALPLQTHLSAEWGSLVFGRKGIKRELPEQIDVSKADDVNWLKSQRDPAIWHDAAIICLTARGDKHGFLPWLVEQLELDRSTAAFLLLWSDGPKFLRGGTDFWAKIDDLTLISILKSLCERSAVVGFINDNIGLSDDWNAKRLDCLAIQQEGMVANGIVFPSAVLDDPFIDENDNRPYVNMGDGELVSLAQLREDMPFLFDD